MAHKHLHELLKEDQEPFLLKNYIFDRRSQLNRPIIPKPKSKTELQAKKSIPISNSTRRRPENSPFSDFRWPATAKSPNSVLLHVPAKTAALLLEAAKRIDQKKSSGSKPKTRRVKNVGFGVFGSILKRLSGKNGSRKREVARKSDGKSEKVRENPVVVDDKSYYEMGFACYRGLETSSSSKSEAEAEERENGSFGFCEKRFCSSPISPFRFSLEKSPSSCRQKPNFSSPATSPCRREKQEEKCEAESIQKIHVEEEEEEKEQCSPVSVLDPPFEDDDEEGHEDGGDEDDYDLECSYAIVQRTKQRLLHKLRRFEKLAELDPLELGKRMLEDQEDNDDNEDLEEEEEEEEIEDDNSLPFYSKKNDIDRLVREIFTKSDLHLGKVSVDMKRLVVDLVAAEKREEDGSEDSDEVVVKRVCERLDSLKEVESYTIDMMVELDFRREIDGWKRNDRGQVGEVAVEIEVSIFGLLVEELSEDICLRRV